MMPKITQRSLEQNWYNIHHDAILNMIRVEDENGFKKFYSDVVGPKPSLSQLVQQMSHCEEQPIDVQPGHYHELIKLMTLISGLGEQSLLGKRFFTLLAHAKAPIALPLGQIFAKSNEEGRVVEHVDAGGDEGNNEDARRSDTTPLTATTPPSQPSPYEEGFEFAKKKRIAAQNNRQKWFLEHQLNQMKELSRLAWWGKIRAVMYGLAVGIALAGFMLLFFNAHLSAAAMAVMGFTLIPFLSYFPAKANFWITRRDPSELSFDLFSPHEPADTERPQNDGWSNRTYAILNTQYWGYTVKEMLARVGGFLNATVYGGLAATGMWEFFTEFGLNTLYSSVNFTIGSMTIPYAAIPCAIVTFAMSRMVFKPELGLGVKFIRGWLNKNPFQSFTDMNRTVNPEGRADNPYFLRFMALFTCIVIGGIFTTLAAADLVGSLTGGSSLVIKLCLSVLTVSVLPFYYQKAIDNVLKVHRRDQAEEKGQQLQDKKPEPALFSHAWFVRRLNALINAVPAFLGGMITFAGPGGIIFGLFTGAAGFGASYISGENGEEEGYENEIEHEINETKLALLDNSSEWIEKEPEIEVEGQGVQLATKQPYLLNFCNMSRETKQSALDLLEVRVPMPSSDEADIKLKIA